MNIDYSAYIGYTASIYSQDYTVKLDFMYPLFNAYW